MLKRTVLITLFAATALAFGSAQQSTVTLKAGKTPANDGKGKRSARRSSNRPSIRLSAAGS